MTKRSLDDASWADPSPLFSGPASIPCLSEPQFLAAAAALAAESKTEAEAEAGDFGQRERELVEYLSLMVRALRFADDHNAWKVPILVPRDPAPDSPLGLVPCGVGAWSADYVGFHCSRGLSAEERTVLASLQPFNGNVASFFSAVAGGTDAFPFSFEIKSRGSSWIPSDKPLPTTPLLKLLMNHYVHTHEEEAAIDCTRRDAKKPRGPAAAAAAGAAPALSTSIRFERPNSVTGAVAEYELRMNANKFQIERVCFYCRRRECELRGCLHECSSDSWLMCITGGLVQISRATGNEIELRAVGSFCVRPPIYESLNASGHLRVGVSAENSFSTTVIAAASSSSSSAGACGGSAGGAGGGGGDSSSRSELLPLYPPVRMEVLYAFLSSQGTMRLTTEHLGFLRELPEWLPADPLQWPLRLAPVTGGSQSSPVFAAMDTVVRRACRSKEEVFKEAYPLSSSAPAIVQGLMRQTGQTAILRGLVLVHNEVHDDRWELELARCEGIAAALNKAAAAAGDVQRYRVHQVTLFHGTTDMSRLHKVLVRGFKDPLYYTPLNGASFGRGIYLASNPCLALRYGADLDSAGSSARAPLPAFGGMNPFGVAGGGGGVMAILAVKLCYVLAVDVDKTTSSSSGPLGPGPSGSGPFGPGPSGSGGSGGLPFGTGRVGLSASAAYGPGPSASAPYGRGPSFAPYGPSGSGPFGPGPSGSGGSGGFPFGTGRGGPIRRGGRDEDRDLLCLHGKYFDPDITVAEIPLEAAKEELEKNPNVDVSKIADVIVARSPSQLKVEAVLFFKGFRDTHPLHH